jgi:hypothetical protein
MEWYAYLAYLLAGVLLANSVPHFVYGITGRRFQSPFALPPGVGESSAVVNVVWGLVSFFAGYALIFGVGEFAIGLTRSALMVGIGAAVAAIGLALYFGQVRGR